VQRLKQLLKSTRQSAAHEGDLQRLSSSFAQVASATDTGLYRTPSFLADVETAVRGELKRSLRTHLQSTILPQLAESLPGALAKDLLVQVSDSLLDAAADPALTASFCSVLESKLAAQLAQRTHSELARMRQGSAAFQAALAAQARTQVDSGGNPFSLPLAQKLLRLSEESSAAQEKTAGLKEIVARLKATVGRLEHLLTSTQLQPLVAVDD
jgi:hypothetical protein